jgi:nucleotide-binding universal stress UspA family protein
MGNSFTQKILVPHDGSEMSDRALDKAIEFAKALNSEIIILHIADDKLIPSEPILAFLSEKSNTITDAKSQILNLLRIGAEQLLKDRTEKVKKNDNKLKFLGSVARSVSEISVCPVMIIK